MRVIGLLLMFAALSACDKTPAVLGSSNDVGSALDEQAIEAGILPDPKALEFAGRFETRGDLGTDKFCAVESGTDFDIGFMSNSGPDSKCEGRGTAIVEGDKVRFTLSGKGECKFEARYDGIELRLPGALDDDCAAYCTQSASFSGTHYFMVEQGDEAARKTLGRDIERLCD